MNYADTINYEQDFRPPMTTATFGLLIFLLSLGILFIASIVGYLVIRLGGKTAPQLGIIDVPWPLYLSTAGLIASSFTLHYAYVSARKKKYEATRLGMVLTLLLGMVFLIVQTPSLIELGRRHFAAVAETQSMRAATNIVEGGPTLLYGLIFLLIILHALHVIGGMIPMVLTTSRTIQGTYTKPGSSPDGIHRLAMYWHFLDVVWIVMLAVFVFVG